MSLLVVKELTKNFGGLAAVSSVSLTIEPGEIVGLIGPNGAGKTTFFNVLTGVYEPSSGSIQFQKDNQMILLERKKPHIINQLGIGRTFQNIRLFKNLTVLDNVKAGMHNEAKYGVLSAILRLPIFYRREAVIENEALALLTLMKLNDKIHELAQNLSYGEQRRLEIARALATRPTLLFLDEPAAGMNPQETAELTDLIYQIKNDFGITVLLIEHDMSLVMRICERIYVLDYGRLIASGTPEQIKQNKKVIQAYLGEEI